MLTRVRILQQFDLGGFRYVVGAIVAVAPATAQAWVAEGKAELFGQPAVPAPVAVPPVAQA